MECRWLTECRPESFRAATFWYEESEQSSRLSEVNQNGAARKSSYSFLIMTEQWLADTPLEIPSRRIIRFLNY
jgi:hypothetical protein